MQQKQIYILAALLIILALTLNACGSSASNESTIATSVAMTVQAQNTQQAQSNPTPTTSSVTDVPPLLATPKTDATKAPPTAPSVGGTSPFCTASASILDGNYPDGTIVSSGAVFTKIWRITNTGTCPWDSTWKIVFSNGDLLGGAGSYPFPQPVKPGETVDVPVVFTASTLDGTYKGTWKLQSPWGTQFATFWVQVVVGSGVAGKGTATAFSITSVTYDVTHTGVCTDANMFFTITAYVTSNGPLTINYYWVDDYGNHHDHGILKFTEATSKSISVMESWRIGTSNKQHWDQLIVTDPYYQEFGKATYSRNCQ